VQLQLFASEEDDTSDSIFQNWLAQDEKKRTELENWTCTLTIVQEKIERYNNMHPARLALFKRRKIRGFRDKVASFISTIREYRAQFRHAELRRTLALIIGPDADPNAGPATENNVGIDLMEAFADIVKDYPSGASGLWGAGVGEWASNFYEHCRNQAVRSQHTTLFLAQFKDSEAFRNFLDQRKQNLAILVTADSLARLVTDYFLPRTRDGWLGLFSTVTQRIAQAFGSWGAFAQSAHLRGPAGDHWLPGPSCSSYMRGVHTFATQESLTHMYSQIIQGYRFLVATEARNAFFLF
jgi:hypothetical protein